MIIALLAVLSHLGNTRIKEIFVKFMEIKFGCTGWSYEGWVGTFYPKSLQNSNWLKYYSKIFDLTEINSTYYRIPTRVMAKKWEYDTPSSFRFTAKFPRIITHEKRLKEVKSEVSEFLSAMSPLKNKIFGFVIQLPPSLTFDEARPRLQELFDYLPKFYKYPIEGRHESWFSTEAISFLSEQNYCLVWNEIEGISNTHPLTSDFVYIRLIGDRSIPDSQFGRVLKNRDSLITKWAEKLEKIKEKVGLALVLSNNHFEGFAPATTNSLRMKLGYKEILWEEKKQKTFDSDFSN